MARIMAIDYGLKRVGLAVTDPLQIIATPLCTVAQHETMDYIKKYVAQEEVEKFVLGYPMNMDYTPSQIAPHVEAFEKFLKRTFPNIPVERGDERFTSQLALQAIRTGGVKKKDRQDKSMVDKLSAVLILQSYLDLTKK